MPLTMVCFSQAVNNSTLLGKLSKNLSRRLHMSYLEKGYSGFGFCLRPLGGPRVVNLVWVYRIHFHTYSSGIDHCMHDTVDSRLGDLILENLAKANPLFE